MPRSIAFAGVLAAAAAVAALLGMYTPPWSAAPPPSAPPRASIAPEGLDERVLARGAMPVGGRWQLRGYGSRGVTLRGKVVERRGAPCLRLMLLAPPEGTTYAGRGYCGRQGTGGFNVASLYVRDIGGRAELALFGQAPAEAVAVVLSGAEGTRRVTTARGRPDRGDRLWVMAVPPHVEAPRLRWLRRDGSTGGAIEATRWFREAPGRERA